MKHFRQFKSLKCSAVPVNCDKIEPTFQSLQLLLFLLFPLEDDLRYEGDSWEDQTYQQEDQGEVEMLQSKWLELLLLLVFLEWSFIYQQTSLEWNMSNMLIIMHLTCWNLIIWTLNCSSSHHFLLIM